MCNEDVKLGLRRYFKVNSDPALGFILKANAQRVGIRLIVLTNLAGDGQARLSAANTADRGSFLFVNAGNPVCDMTLETHGLAVQSEMVLFVTGNCSILEILDDEIGRPPPPGDPYDALLNK